MKAGLLATSALACLNLSVAWFGSSFVFPLSPYFLREKATALGLYARHRAGCLLRGHDEIAPIVRDAEHRHGLPAGLLEALIEVESNSRVHRISAAGAMGPGQLTAGTARFLKVADPFDPATSIDGSARYLAAQLRRFGEVPLALAAYNAGPGSVAGRIPRNGETEYYVPKVLAEYARRRPPPEASKPAPLPARHAPR